MINDVGPKFKRDKTLIRQFVVKTVAKMIVIFTIVFIAYLIAETPIFTNQVAMGQLENSDEWFVAMQAYQKFANVTRRVSQIVIMFIIGWIGHDGYSLAKNLKITEN